MAETHELRLKINASAARAGSREFRAAIESIEQAVAGLDRDTNGLFTKLKAAPKLTVNTKGATVNLDRVRQGVKRFEDAATRASLSAAQSLRTSQGEARRLADSLHQIGDTSGVARINAALADLQRRLQSASTPLDVRVARSGFKDVESSLRQIEITQKKAATEAQNHAEKLEMLAAKYNPLWSASKRYETALEEIALAEREGVLSANLAADARQKAALALQTAGTQANKFAGQSNNAAFAAQNLTFQFNDIATMLAAGQSPLLLASQQGLQVSQALQMAGASGKSAFATLRAGALSFMSPMTLATVGAIALGAAIVQGIGSALPEVKSLDDALSDLEDQIQKVASTTRAVDDGGGYARLNNRIRERLELEKELARLDAAKGFRVKQDALFSEFAEVGWMDSLAGFADNATGQIRMLSHELSLSKEQATDLAKLLRDTSTAEGPRQAAKAYQNARNFLLETVGGVENLNEEQATLYRRLLDVEGAADDLVEAKRSANRELTNAVSLTDAWASAMSGVRSEVSAIASGLANIGGNVIGNAAMATELEALQAGSSIRDAEIARRRYEAEADFSARENAAGNGLGGLFDRAMIAAERAQFEERIRLENELDSARSRARANERAATSGGSGRAKQLEEETESIKRLTQAWSESVPTWEQAGRTIENQVLDSLAGSIERFAMTGEMSFEDMANSILATMTKLASELAVMEIFSAMGIQPGEGGGFGLGDLIGNFVPAFFGSGGGVTSGPGPSMPTVMAPAAAFNRAPSYASGVANTTGGVPSILHKNESVVPLTGGRKIPVELGGDAMGGGFNQTIIQNISTPDVESFRRSQKNIAADAGMASQRAMKANR